MGKLIEVFSDIKIPENGIVLEGIEITEDSISIKLLTDRGPFIGVCDADCCSETWIENVELPALGFPCRVVGVSDLEMPDSRPSEEGEPQEHIEFYGLKFVTTHGDLVIDFRNASNGYYGGSLEWSPDRFYSGVFNQQEPNQIWISIEEWLRRKNLCLSETKAE